MWFDILNSSYNMIGIFLLTVVAPISVYLGVLKLFSKKLK